MEIPQIKSSRVLHWVGDVTAEKVETFSKDLVQISFKSDEPILLGLTNLGGTCSFGFGFYDLVRYVLRCQLYTCVAGSAESMGVILFLSATKARIMTKNASLFFHQISRKLESRFYSSSELKNLSKDNNTWMQLYAKIVAENSKEKLSSEDVLKIMHEEKRIFAEEAKEMGLCDYILDSMPLL